jgi:hypothetical protein
MSPINRKPRAVPGERHLDRGGTADALDGVVILKSKMVSDLVLSTVSDWVKKDVKPEVLLISGRF